jgi:hypothetical protein
MAITIKSKRLQEFKARYERQSSDFYDKYNSLYGILAVHGLGERWRRKCENWLQELRMNYPELECQKMIDELEDKNQKAKDRLAKREQERAENVASGRLKNQSKAEARQESRQPVVTMPPTPGGTDIWDLV